MLALMVCMGGCVFVCRESLSGFHGQSDISAVVGGSGSAPSSSRWPPFPGISLPLSSGWHGGLISVGFARVLCGSYKIPYWMSGVGAVMVYVVSSCLVGSYNIPCSPLCLCVGAGVSCRLMLVEDILVRKEKKTGKRKP